MSDTRLLTFDLDVNDQPNGQTTLYKLKRFSRSKYFLLLLVILLVLVFFSKPIIVYFKDAPSKIVRIDSNNTDLFNIWFENHSISNDNQRNLIDDNSANIVLLGSKFAKFYSQQNNLNCKIWHNYGTEMTYEKKLNEMNLFDLREMFPRDGRNPPEFWDWNKMGFITPAKNQSECGSCWAFATVALIEALYAIAGVERLDLSEQQLIECTWPYDCEGNRIQKALYYATSCGLLEEKYNPYKATHNTTNTVEKCSKTMNKTESERRYQLDLYGMLPNNEEDIMHWIAFRGPVIVVFSVRPSFRNFRREFASGRIYGRNGCSDRPSSSSTHAILVFGYGVDEGIPYWSFKNSWGIDWGMNGTGKIYRGKNSCVFAGREVKIIGGVLFKRNDTHQ